MRAIPNFGEEPGDPTPVPGGDVREPPLPAEQREDKLPGRDENPGEGGETIKERL